MSEFHIIDAADIWLSFFHHGILVKYWLDNVNKMAFLNGVVDFHFSEDVIQALVYAYHVKFTPIEAVAFVRLVANKVGDADPDKVREIEARAQKLVVVTKSDKDYNANLVQEHVSRFIENATPHEREPQSSQSLSLGIAQGD